MNIFRTIIIALALLTFGCDNSSSAGGEAPPSNPEETNAVMQTLSLLRSNGELPELDRSDSLSGQDADNNGIRDDIDAYIGSLPLSIDESEALKMSAQWFQSISEIDTNDREAAFLNAEEGNEWIICMERAFGDLMTVHNHQQKLAAYTFNTPARVDHYIAYNEALDDTVSEAPDKNSISCP